MNYGRVTVVILLFSCTMFTTRSALAQSQHKGDASLRVEYQYIKTGSFFDALYEFDYSYFDWYLNKKYQLSGTYFTGIWAEQSNEVDKAFTVALTRYWGGGEHGDGN